MGGVPAALAADIYPCKIAAMVFLTSSMHDTKNPPAYTFEKVHKLNPPLILESDAVGCKYSTRRVLRHCLRKAMGHLIVLYRVFFSDQRMLVRVNPIVTNNLAGTRSFTEEGYGSVTRIYIIICGEDNIVPEEYQSWIINNFPPKEVIERSKMQIICQCSLSLKNSVLVSWRLQTNTRKEL